MSERILIVDDEPAVLDGIRRQLHRTFQLEFANSGAEALAKCEAEGSFAAIVSDMRMPAMNGVELLEQTARRWPEMVRVMLTGNADQETAVAAVNSGHIHTFLNKPVSRETIETALAGALRLHRLEIAEKTLLERTLAGTIRTLVEILASALPEAFGDSQALRRLVKRLAGPLEGNAWRLDMAAMLLPIGWTTLPPALCQRYWRGASLDSDERKMIERVPEISARLLANIPRLDGVADVIGLHLKIRSEAAPGSVARDAGILGLAIAMRARSGGAVVTREAMETAIAAYPWIGPEQAPALRRLVQGQGESPEAVHLPLAEKPVPVMVESPRLLKSGDLLAADVVFDDGTLILAAGMELSDLQIAKLVNLGEMRRLRGPTQVLRR
jgi:response regulator RpfG family c-di-GMP phosphodiesterase